MNAKEFHAAGNEMLRRLHNVGHVGVSLVSLMETELGISIRDPLRARLEQHFTEGFSEARVDTALQMIAEAA